MQIVVLDGYTLNPGDLSWATLEALGPCTIHDRTPDDEVIARAGGAEIVLTNKTVLSREAIAGLHSLRYVGVLATGYNVVDIAAAREHGVVVSNVPAYSTKSVAQMALAHLLNLALHVGHHAQTVAEGRWTRSPEFCYWDYPLVELEGLQMGIVGYGQTGRATAALCRALGMDVVVYSPRPPAELPPGVTSAGLDEVFRNSDAVSLHCPLTAETLNLVNRDRLALMKPTAFLINTSRGQLVDESALAAALGAGQIAGAGLDVLSTEPPKADNPLLRAKNCYITPHIAWATKSARKRLLKVAVENVQAFLAGTPKNVVT